MLKRGLWRSPFRFYSCQACTGLDLYSRTVCEGHSYWLLHDDLDLPASISCRLWIIANLEVCQDLFGKMCAQCLQGFKRRSIYGLDYWLAKMCVKDGLS